MMHDIQGHVCGDKVKFCHCLGRLVGTRDANAFTTKACGCQGVCGNFRRETLGCSSSSMLEATNANTSAILEHDNSSQLARSLLSKQHKDSDLAPSDLEKSSIGKCTV
jgi:hypothetical protein